MSVTAWLLHSDGGLLLRIAGGGAIFACLAIQDLRRHGRAATGARRSCEVVREECVWLNF